MNEGANNSSRICLKCGHRGHLAKHRFTKRENHKKNLDNHKEIAEPKKQGTQETSSKRVAMSVGDIDGNMKESLLADSGASDHMCNCQEWFRELKLYGTPRECEVGNGNKVKIYGEGLSK